MTKEEKDKLDQMVNNLYYVAGYITDVSKCYNTAVIKCDCRDCNMLNRVHDCMNIMQAMIKDSK